jgi:nicotinamide riboside transporter PnuC
MMLSVAALILVVVYVVGGYARSVVIHVVPVYVWSDAPTASTH